MKYQIFENKLFVFNFSEYTVEKDGRLTIPKVNPDDAGMYVCSAGNELGKIEQPMELVVGDLVPYFPQNPVSYITYPPMNDVYLDFDILLRLKPEATDGKCRIYSLMRC